MVSSVARAPGPDSCMHSSFCQLLHMTESHIPLLRSGSTLVLCCAARACIAMAFCIPVRQSELPLQAQQDRLASLASVKPPRGGQSSLILWTVKLSLVQERGLTSGPCIALHSTAGTGLVWTASNPQTSGSTRLLSVTLSEPGKVACEHGQ